MTEAYPEISFLNYEELCEELHALVVAYPDLASLESLGKSAQGRDLWLLKIGGDFDRIRPALWIDGNMHAMEFSGTSVCLAFARSILKRLSSWQTVPPSAVAEKVLNNILYYIMPRISPDGAEAVLSTGVRTRSVMRGQTVPPTKSSTWDYSDLTGDGCIRLLRQEHPNGDWVAHVTKKNLMRLRTIQDNGPFYRVFSEGEIKNFDGFKIPDSGQSEANTFDLNRNFPFGWKAAHEQYGAGDYPGSLPESKAVIEFATAHPNIFAWVNYHCFGGVYIRPLGHKPDNKMNPFDLDVYKMLGDWTEELTGYPMVSGCEEFLYEPDKALAGDLSEWAYEHRGSIGMVCELWDIFKRLDIERRPFIENYLGFSNEELEALYDWDQDNNDSRTFLDWTTFKHPQLGDVEIGGIDPRVGTWNPPDTLLPEVCHNQGEFLQRLASLAPQLTMDVFEQVEDRGFTKLTVDVRNIGALPTSVLDSAKKLSINEGIVVSLECSDGLELVAGDAIMRLGNLSGWFMSNKGFRLLPIATGSPANLYEQRCIWQFSGTGVLTVTVGNRRCGFVTKQIEI